MTEQKTYTPAQCHVRQLEDESALLVSTLQMYNVESNSPALSKRATGIDFYLDDEDEGDNDN